MNMKEFTYVITDKEGIHARPAGELVKLAKEYTSTVSVIKEGKKADAKKVFGLMGLGVKNGMEITVQIEGEDEDTAAAAVEAFLKENL
jgi:phosphocarrier protein